MVAGAEHYGSAKTTVEPNHPSGFMDEKRTQAGVTRLQPAALRREVPSTSLGLVGDPDAYFRPRHQLSRVLLIPEPKGGWGAQSRVVRMVHLLGQRLGSDHSLWSSGGPGSRLTRMRSSVITATAPVVTSSARSSRCSRNDRDLLFCGSVVAASEQDDRGRLPSCERQECSEVGFTRDDDPLFVACHVEQHIVVCALESAFEGVDSVVACFAEQVSKSR